MPDDPPGVGDRDDRAGERPTGPLTLDGSPPSSPPPGPPGYGYGYPAGPQNDSSATAALVIAIVGFFICAPVGAIVALVLANSAQKRIEASNGQLGGLDMARAARIIAIIALVLTVLLAVLVPISLSLMLPN